MSASIQQRGDKFQLRIIDKLLSKPFFYTHESRAEVERVRDDVVRNLKLGIVPHGLVVGEARTEHDPPLFQIIKDYERLGDPAPSDHSTLTSIISETTGMRRSDLTLTWADDYARRLKVEKHLAPGTVRKRIGALARVMDWYIREEVKRGQPQAVNPLRMMPKGYSRANRDEARLLTAADKEIKTDNARNFRVPPEVEQPTRLAMLGLLKHADRERPMKADPELELMFDLIINTGLRLFEAFRLTIDRIDFAGELLHVEGSKGWRGKEKPRTVPLVPHLVDRLKQHCGDRKGLVFSFWDGEMRSRNGCSNRLSQRFATAFAHAGFPHLREHDLRHEATCRWILMRDEHGWLFGDTEICKIMGWENPRMMLRYASLRGQDLANRMRRATIPAAI